MKTHTQQPPAPSAQRAARRVTAVTCSLCEMGERETKERKDAVVKHKDERGVVECVGMRKRDDPAEEEGGVGEKGFHRWEQSRTPSHTQVPSRHGRGKESLPPLQTPPPISDRIEKQPITTRPYVICTR